MADRQGVTVAFVPTALAQDLVRDDWATARLRYIPTGADRRSAVRARAAFALVNNYGLTNAPRRHLGDRANG